MTTERITNFTDIDNVIKAFMSRRGEKSLTNFEKYRNIAIQGFSDLNLFNLNSIQVAYIPVDTDTKIARLPSDFLMLSKIGVNICGVVWTLTMNPNITMPRPETICSFPIEDCENCTDIANLGGYPFVPFWSNGVYISTLYGVSGGFNECYYKIDETNQRILLQGNIRNNEIILEYVSNGITSGLVPIPRIAQPALMAYLEWVTIEYDMRIPMQEKVRKENLYDKELVALNRVSMGFTCEEFLDVWYSTLNQGVKR